MKTLTVLPGWQRIIVEARVFGRQEAPLQIPIFVSPKERFYRLAASWEGVDLLITAPVWDADQDIRLCRLREPELKKLATQQRAKRSQILDRRRK